MLLRVNFVTNANVKTKTIKKTIKEKIIRKHTMDFSKQNSQNPQHYHLLFYN